MNKKEWAVEKLTLRVQRYDPDRDRAPRPEEYVVPFLKGMTILDGLLYIKENLDSTLAFRTSCRMGICGSCGMLINSFPRLACHTPIEELRQATLEIKPMPNLPTIKDLVSDLTPLFEKHKSVKPYLMPVDVKEMEEPTAEFLQAPKDLEGYVQFAYCIKCGLCMTACPTAATDRFFLGPQPLAQAYRYCADSRDGKPEPRIDAVDNPHGVWLCHLAGACSEACPKGVDPALAIQLLKRAMLFDSIRLRKQPAPAETAGPSKETKPRVAVPEFTVK